MRERTLVSFDWAMKRILRDKANFDVLEGFLSALLNEEIQVIDLLESEANQNDDGDKFNRVDLKVKDAQNVEFIKHSEIPEQFAAKNIQAARQKLAWMKMSLEERDAYEKFAMARASYQDELQGAKEEGRKEGLEEGRKEGLEEGTRNKAVAVATILKQQGLSVALIVQATGLSPQEVEGLA